MKGHKFAGRTKACALVMLLVLAVSFSGLVLPGHALASPPYQESDPWQQAVEEAQQVLASTDLLAHIQQYQATIAQLDGYLGQVEAAEPALAIADQLKHTDIPFLGNAWDLLIQGLDASMGGAGQALIAVDKGLRILLDYHRQLQSLQSLDEVATAIQTFQQNPSPETLKAMAAAMKSHQTTLSEMEKVVGDLHAQVSDIHESLTLARQALAQVGMIAPQLGEDIDTIKRVLDTVAEPVADIYKLSDETLTQIHSDQDAFRQIQDILYRAEHPPTPMSDQGPARLTISMSDEAGAQQIVGTLAEQKDQIEAIVSHATKKLAAAAQVNPSILLIGGIGALLILIGLVFLSTHSGPEPIPQREIGTQASSANGTWLQGTFGQPQPAKKVLAIEQVAPMRLRVLHGPQAGMVYPLTRDDIRVGRSAVCHIRFADPTVSREHFRLRYAQGAWFIQDQNSKAGTFVNGQRVLAQRLQPGDKIQLGNVVLRFEPMQPAA